MVRREGLILEFALYSFLGWLYETILTSVSWGRFADRGWLHLPICPIYGFGAMLILAILGKFRNVPLIFVLGTALTTAVELAASYLLSDFRRLWDYSGWRLNFQGRIALGSSMIFGVLCVLLVRVLHPASVYLQKKMSARMLRITSVIIVSVIILDFLITLLEIHGNTVEILEINSISVYFHNCMVQQIRLINEFDMIH